MTQQIFYLCSCNEYKEYSSMIPILMTTDEEVLWETIRKEIRQGNMEYDGKDIDEMVDNFDEDWETSNRGDINSKLVYGYYDYTEDGTEMNGF